MWLNLNWILTFLLFAITISAHADDRIQRISGTDSAEQPDTAAVVVSDGLLIWTTQYLPEPSDVTASEPAQQLTSCFEKLRNDLKTHGSDTHMIVRLSVYVATPDMVDPVRDALRRRFTRETMPAISVCVTKLPTNAHVALDAVAAVPASRPEPSTSVVWHPRLSVMPPGSRIFVSGQAEQDEDLATATRKTLQSLRETLTFLKRSDADVVQLKVFVQPMSSASLVETEVARFYNGETPPPLVQVEWKSSLRTPIEIELVAWGGPASAVSPNAQADAEYITPPGFTQSPVYCRVCRVPAGRMIFTSGMTGTSQASGDAESEVHSAFTRLSSILDKAGSDMKHLAKATYYVSNDPVSAALNKVRPGYYDPQRPPAASKAMTEFVEDGRGLMMDMIAVPVH